MSKQTAVQWLLQRFEDGDMYNVEDAQFIKHQALTMEKEQIVEAHYRGGCDFQEAIECRKQEVPYVNDAEKYYNKTYKGYQMDNIDKFIIALKDLIIEYKGNNPNYIANEISNRISCYKISDRESFDYDQTGVLYHFYTMLDVLNNIDKK